MRHFVYCAALAAAVFFLAGCGGNPNKKNASETQTSETQSSVMEVDNLLADAEKLTGGKVTVEGVCTHICRHGGRKIFLMGTDDTQVIRIEAGEKIGSFKPECVNNVVRVTGTLVEDRIDEAYLAEWELRLTPDRPAARRGRSRMQRRTSGPRRIGCQQHRKAYRRLPCPYRRPQSQRRQGIPFVLPCGRREL